MAEVHRPLGELLDRRAKWLLLISLLLAHFIGGLNQFLVATATPKMLVDLGGFGLLPWVFTIYMLGSTIAAPIAGRLSDTFGRKTFLTAAILLFLAGTLGCGVAFSMPMLIAFRAVQGIGGGMILACVIATLADLFPPAERGKYFGLFIGAQTVAGLSGPAVGGVLTDFVSWRAVFFINVPLAAVALTFITINLPARRGNTSLREIDFVGSALLAAATTSVLLAMTWGQEAYGWRGTETLALLGAGGGLIAVFILNSRGNPHAVLPLSIFRSREFTIVSVATVLFSAGTQGTVQYLPTFVQTAMQASATVSGLITTPQAIAMLLASLIGGQITARSGKYKVQCIIGSLVALAGALLLMGVHAEQPRWQLGVFMFVLGFGGGLVTPTMSLVSQNALPQGLVGVASGARMFFLQMGTVLGMALFGAILASSYQGSFDAQVSSETRANVPAALLAEFDDPTLALDEEAFAAIQADLRALPGGEELAEELVHAQREGVADATHDVFMAAAIVLGLALLLTFTLADLPLRRTLSEPDTPPPAMAAPGPPGLEPGPAAKGSRTG